MQGGMLNSHPSAFWKCARQPLSASARYVVGQAPLDPGSQPSQLATDKLHYTPAH